MATHDYKQRQLGRQDLHPETLVISYGYDLFCQRERSSRQYF